MQRLATAVLRLLRDYRSELIPLMTSDVSYTGIGQRDLTNGVQGRDAYCIVLPWCILG